MKKREEKGESEGQDYLYDRGDDKEYSSLVFRCCGLDNLYLLEPFELLLVSIVTCE